ncbi:MAG: YitT family protein [Candidatus Coproplasma sp.]
MNKITNGAPRPDKKQAALEALKKYLVITLGCLIYATGIALFVSPANLSSGGMTGISIIINHYVPQLTQGVWYIILNVPMIVLGLIFFGWKFLLSTGYATAVSALMMSAWELILGEKGLNVLPFTQGMDTATQYIIGAVVGGILFGVGMGLIFRMGASTAGTDIIVKLLRKRFRHIPTGMISLGTDMAIVACSLFIKPDIQTLFYTAMSVIVFTIVFDWVLYGGNSAKMVYIITDKTKYESITQKLLTEVDTGATIVDARGAYTKEDKIMLLCVVKSFMYPRLRDVVKEEDKNAFMIVSSAKEIYGKGYKDQDEEEV